jgi:hypothetical protein
VKTHAAVPYTLSLVAGLATCLAIMAVSGRKEAWDSNLYFVAGIPAMCVAAFALARAWPVRAWRWVVVMAVGQTIPLLLAGGSLALWPLSIIAMTVLSLPQFAVAILASHLARRE